MLVVHCELPCEMLQPNLSQLKFDAEINIFSGLVIKQWSTLTLVMQQQQSLQVNSMPFTQQMTRNVKMSHRWKEITTSDLLILYSLLGGRTPNVQSLQSSASDAAALAQNIQAFQYKTMDCIYKATSFSRLNNHQESLFDHLFSGPRHSLCNSSITSLCYCFLLGSLGLHRCTKEAITLGIHPLPDVSALYRHIEVEECKPSHLCGWSCPVGSVASQHLETLPLESHRFPLSLN